MRLLSFISIPTLFLFTIILHFHHVPSTFYCLLYFVFSEASIPISLLISFVIRRFWISLCSFVKYFRWWNNIFNSHPIGHSIINLAVTSLNSRGNINYVKFLGLALFTGLFWDHANKDWVLYLNTWSQVIGFPYVFLGISSSLRT